jgi:hypothetical protein
MTIDHHNLPAVDMIFPAVQMVFESVPYGWCSRGAHSRAKPKISLAQGVQETLRWIRAQTEYIPTA